MSAPATRSKIKILPAPELSEREKTERELRAVKEKRELVRMKLELAREKAELAAEEAQLAELQRPVAKPKPKPTVAPKVAAPKVAPAKGRDSSYEPAAMNKRLQLGRPTTKPSEGGTQVVYDVQSYALTSNSIAEIVRGAEGILTQYPTTTMLQFIFQSDLNHANHTGLIVSANDLNAERIESLLQSWLQDKIASESDGVWELTHIRLDVDN